MRMRCTHYLNLLLFPRQPEWCPSFWEGLKEPWLLRFSGFHVYLESCSLASPDPLQIILQGTSHPCPDLGMEVRHRAGTSFSPRPLCRSAPVRITHHVLLTLSHHSPPPTSTPCPQEGALSNLKIPEHWEPSLQNFPPRLSSKSPFPCTPAFLSGTYSLAFFPFLLKKKADNGFVTEKFLLSPSALVRYNWHVTLYSLRVYNVTIAYLYIFILNKPLWIWRKGNSPPLWVGM